ncbi:MarR family winged helix-turn-helix transcriptional regulator [Algirhabdus cladophorae]|uniref:MarR family winged helix-turn-helix transcriptional regulator n=1 Tax=Algirhabdus cladophorae TaxID=3377108 RepID=UPI003B848202
MPDSHLPLYFGFFNEIGILEQLSRARLEARLPDGLLVSHFAVINHLIRVQDGRTPVELARAFQVAKTTMTHTLGGLEKHGFVELRPNPDDKRSKRVWLTPKGQGFRDQSIAAMAPDMAQLVDVIPPDELAQLLPILQKIRVYLDESRN